MGYRDGQPLSRVQNDRKDIRNSIMVHQKDMGIVKWGRRQGSRHSTGRCNDEDREVRVSKYPGENLGVSLAGLKVDSVEPGGAGWHAGLDGFVGRRITHVNGQRVGCADDVRDIASTASDVHLQFRGVFDGKGRRHNSEPRGRSARHNISHTRFARGYPVKNSESGVDQCMAVRSVPQSPSRGSMPPSPRKPYGTDAEYRILEAGGRENVPAVGAAPDMRPAVKRRFASSDAGRSPMRYKFPTNMSAAQMESYGLKPGGGPLTQEELARSVRRGSSGSRGMGTRFGKNMASRPVDNIRSSSLCPTTESRWPGRSNSCPPEHRHATPPPSPGGKRRVSGTHGTTLTFLHHSAHPNVSQSWTPTWNSDRYTSPCGSPGRRRTTNHHAPNYNNTFLSQPRSFDTDKFKNPKRQAPDAARGTLDIANRRPAPAIVSQGTGKRTTMFACTLPQAEDKFKGATRRHPHPVPLPSDVMCTRTLPRHSCRGEDVNDFDGKGKQQYPQRSTHEVTSPRPRGRSLVAAYDTPRQVSQRRAHTPGPAPPPFGVDHVTMWG